MRKNRTTNFREYKNNHVYDKLGREDYVTEWLRGLLENTKEGVMTKYNEPFKNNFDRLIRRYYSTILAFCEVRHILEITMDEYNIPEIRALINTIWRIIYSLHAQKLYFYSVRDRIERYSIEDKDLIKALKNTIIKSDERIDKLQKTILSDYLSYCGLIPYIEYIKTKGMTYIQDMRDYYEKQNVKWDIEYDKNSFYHAYVCKRYNYIRKVMKEECDMEINPDIEAINFYFNRKKEINNKYKEEHLKKKNEKKEQEKIMRKNNARYKLSETFSKYDDVFRTGNYERNGVSQVIYNRLMNRVPKNEVFYIIMIMKGSNPKNVYYLTDDSLNTSLSISKSLVMTDKDKVSEYDRILKDKGYITEILQGKI